jgi:hypothetical protein
VAYYHNSHNKWEKHLMSNAQRDWKRLELKALREAFIRACLLYERWLVDEDCLVILAKEIKRTKQEIKEED